MSAGPGPSEDSGEDASPLSDVRCLPEILAALWLVAMSVRLLLLSEDDCLSSVSVSVSTQPSGKTSCWI